jgi:MoxR-like ATPase
VFESERLSLDLRNKVLNQMSKVVIGRDSEINLLLVCFLAKGHALLEGVPGTSKTLVAKAFSRCMDLSFKRVQFTPDMLPLDILGGFVFNMKNREFEFKRGPIFTNILLADEINRAAPKVQSALLESMQELQVTIEGLTSKLADPFMVIATQNPLDFEGVYPLPESQLDRFMMKIEFGYQPINVEFGIVKRNLRELNVDEVEKVVSNEELRTLFKEVEEVKVSDEMIEYTTRLGMYTRNDARIGLGASPRAIVQLVQSARASAVLDGRDFVTPEDVKFVASEVLAHRIMIDRTATLKGLVKSPGILVKEILDRVSPPR